MTLDNFTIKAQETSLKAQQIAAGLQDQTVETSHLLQGIMETDEHVAAFLLQKMNVNVADLKDKLDLIIQTTPKVHNTDKQYLSNDANQSLARSKKISKDMGDDYISLELMMAGVLEGNDKAG